MKRILILVVALGLFLCSTASAGQGGGGESTKPKPIPKKTSGTKPNNTTPRIGPSAPSARPNTPAVASLTVNANVPNATVTINGRMVGTTDGNGYLLISSLKPGTHSVIITNPGYHPDKTVVTLSAGQSDTLNFELRQLTQYLSVTSTPPECEIFINGTLFGKTDASGNGKFLVVTGEHNITIRKSRYRDAVVALSLTPDKEGQINANLESTIGFLTVATDTPNASIDISGVGRAAGPGSKIECEAGAHTVTISSPLYVTARREVTVSAGQEAELSVALEADTRARSSLISEALEAYSRRQYDRAITLASTLQSADPKHSQALTVLAESYFMKDDFNSFTEFGSQAIEAGGSVEIPLNHQFSAYYLMHPVRLVLTAQTLSFDPQPAQNMVCEYAAFKVSLNVLGAAEVSGNRDNDTFLQLVFVDSNKPKKPTTLRFRDRESYFVEKGKSTAGGLVSYIGHTIVSRRQAYAAMMAIAAVLNLAKAKMKLAAGNHDSRVPAPTTGEPPSVSAQPAGTKVNGGDSSVAANPELSFAGRENFLAGGQNWTRYKLTVTNRTAYPDEMFASAPQLPPCGLNTKSSRTWVDIFDRAGKRLYGFCALGKPSDLDLIWFALPAGQAPPSVFVVLNDRLSGKEYKSNIVAIP